MAAALFHHKLATEALDGLFKNRELPQSLTGTEPSESTVNTPSAFSSLPDIGASWLASAIWSSAADPRLFALSQQICLVRGGKTYEDTQFSTGVLAAEVIQRVAANLYMRDKGVLEAQYRELMKQLNDITSFEPDLIPDLLILACAKLDPLEPLLREMHQRRQKTWTIKDAGRHPLQLLLDLHEEDLGSTPPTRLVAHIPDMETGARHIPDDGIVHIWTGGRRLSYKLQCSVSQFPAYCTTLIFQADRKVVERRDVSMDKKPPDSEKKMDLFMFLELMST